MRTYSAPLRLSHGLRARGADATPVSVAFVFAHRLEMTPALSGRLSVGRSLSNFSHQAIRCQARMRPSTAAPPRPWPTPLRVGRRPFIPRHCSAPSSSGAGEPQRATTPVLPARYGQSARVRVRARPLATHDAIPVPTIGPKRVVGPKKLGGRPPRRPPVCPISAITLAVPWSHPKHHQRCMDCSVSEMFVK